jgi:tetratricopeptide (TPR) repeat protein
MKRTQLIKQQRTLLILDGLEPLQNPPPVETGKIKDPGLTSLLRELARQNPGLVVISTRLSVDDLKDCIDDTVIERDLENLSDESGAAYLKHLGVDGTDEELKEASHDFGGHALALSLLGRYLKVVHGGDIRKRKEIPHVMDEQKQGKHARRVMQSYEVFLKDKPELDVLRLMGLFDRPAEKGALDALRKKPPIKGLTNAIQKLKDADWQYAVANLRDLNLLARPSTALVAKDAPRSAQGGDEELDCHPLLREHFGEQLKATNPAAWREGNNRLYEWYKVSAKEFPDTIQEMAPLYAAVMHGCEAGKYQEAWDEVYRKRIRRGNEQYQVKKLGAFGADLAALSGFFNDTSWSKPDDELREDTKGWLFNAAGFRLRALGRLAEAAQPMQASLDNYIAQKDWKNAAITASNLSELYLTIGDVTQAIAYAEQSFGFADQSGDEFERLGARTKVADALHQVGRLAEAGAAFHEAEEMKKKNQPESPLLSSLDGFLFCDLLLSQGDYAEVGRRANNDLKLIQQGALSSLITIALAYLSLGRAHLLQSQREPDHPSATLRTGSFTESLTYLNRAVDGLRQAGEQTMLPRGLLARAEFYRVTGALDKSQKDLDEAFSIASRGGMGLHLADCHLGFARLHVETFKRSNVQTDILEARKHLATAKEMIEKMGYHRRDKEVEELEEQLK